MLLQHFINKLIFDELIKTNHHLINLKGLQYFGTGNILMERVPRNIKNCSKFLSRIKPITSEDTEPKAKTDISFAWFKPEVSPHQSLSLGNVKTWWKYNNKLLFVKEQEINSERMSLLGSNIAAAYFIIEWNGKVKFKNSEWLAASKNKPVRLPNSYKSNYVITSIDASNTLISYEGLKNMNFLYHLKWLSFKGCDYIDDWCVDKIVGQYQTLEYLDISDCKNVTEKALEALYKLPNLKILIVTNHNKSAAFELACFMLEECNSNLKCQIFNSWYANKLDDKTTPID